MVQILLIKIKMITIHAIETSRVITIFFHFPVSVVTKMFILLGIKYSIIHLLKILLHNTQTNA